MSVRGQAEEKEAQKTLALTKVLENADLALQQAAKAADNKPRRKLPSGAIPEKAQPRRRKKGGKASGKGAGPASPSAADGGSAGAGGEQASSFVLPALGGAAPAPEPEQPAAEEMYGEEEDLHGKLSPPKQKENSPDRSKLSKGERADLDSCHRKPGGAYYPRSHPFLKDSSPSGRGAFLGARSSKTAHPRHFIPGIFC